MGPGTRDGAVGAVGCWLIAASITGAGCRGHEAIRHGDAAAIETGAGGSSSGSGGAVVGSGGSSGDRDAGGAGLGGIPGIDGASEMGGATGSGAGGATGAGGVSGTGGVPGTGGWEGPPLGDALDGLLLKAPCRADTQAYTCSTNPSATLPCPPLDPVDPALSGSHVADTMVTLGGNPAVVYTITLHVQGVVEAKVYPGCADANGSAPSPRANGFCAGGAPVVTDTRNSYLLRVSNPGAVTTSDYFLNSLQPEASGPNLSYGVDYLAQIDVQGGATIRLLASDPNCSMAKNCNNVMDGNACGLPLILQNIEPTVLARNPTFQFTAPYNGQWLAFTVKNVVAR